jgi:formamidopyrimidine-DNA glycosylase
MPELPEVETTASHLNKEVKNKVIKDIWTDWPKYFHPVRNSPPRGSSGARKRAGVISNGVNTPKQNERYFRKMLLGRKILSVGRKGKNILFRLSGGYVMLAHQKMTGHFLVGKWKENKRQETSGKKQEKIWLGQKWIPLENKGPLGDDKNRFIRLIFFLSGGEMLALSDLRRFAKLVLGREKEMLGLPELRELGPEPIDPKFTFKKFLGLFNPPAGGKRGKIKQILLDQKVLSGVGNIYADESLWEARIHPLRRVEELGKTELRALYNALRKVLKKAVKMRGSSVDDYRDPSGRAGFYQNAHQAYHREDEACRRCGAKIKRIKIGQRSAHFCPKCQK